MRRALRWSAILISLFSTAACSGWHQRDISSGVAPVVTGKQQARVTRRDGSSLVILAPRVEGDSLVAQGRGGESRVALPLRDVERVETREVSVGRTALLIGGLLGFMFAFSDSPR